MDKELFKIEFKELNKKCNELKRKFIAENCPYKIGDKMIFDGKPVIIDSIRVHYDGSFVYYVRKTKKDGTPSHIVQCVYSCSMHKLKKA